MRYSDRPNFMKEESLKGGLDSSVWGDIEIQEISRIQKFVGNTLSDNWRSIPHVTHHEEVDITGLDVERKRLSADSGVNITVLAYLVKAAVSGLQRFPKFNASIDDTGNNLILKKYYNIGYAVDTPRGLLVPVVHNADQKDIVEIASEVVRTSMLAREKGLPIGKMSGGSLTISSLGSIGGTAFTPTINAPEVAILGVTKAYNKPRNIDGELIWRTMLPISLSYDHRVINGVDAARFCLCVGDELARYCTGNDLECNK